MANGCRTHRAGYGWLPPLLALLALLAVWSAPIWHQHSDDEQSKPGHEDCAVCAVMAEPTGDGLPDCLIVPVAPAPEFELSLGYEAACSVDVLRQHPARGPPALNA